MMATRNRNRPFKRMTIGRESESETWSAVEDQSARLIALGKLAHRFGDGTIGLEVETLALNIHQWATRMLAQLKAGVHVNPPLTVFSLANPPRRGGQLMSRRLYTIEYQHAEDGKNYYHDFKPGTEMLAMPDGSVLIRRRGAKVWVDLG